MTLVVGITQQSQQKAEDYAKQAKEESDLLVTNIFYSGDPLTVTYTDGRDPEDLTGFFWPKNENGNWARSVNDYTKSRELYEWGYGFNEGGPFQFMFYMQYDVPTLAKMFGTANGIEDSKLALESQLDKFFTSKSDGLGGRYGTIHEADEQQHIGLGQFGINNQPSFGYAYEYNYTDSPWKAQCILRNAMDPNRVDTYYDYDCFGEGKSAGVSTKRGQEIYSLFGTGPQGWLGDEDTGSVSAWYASSAIGLHPVPGTDKIDFGSPIFNKVKISIPAYDEQPAKELTIDAKDNSQQNIYVNAISLNGEQLDLAENNYTINQSQLYKDSNTATLVFSMSKDHS